LPLFFLANFIDNGDMNIFGLFVCFLHWRF